jgi:hypothetical protein
MMECPDCGGKGCDYYDEDGEAIGEEAYRALPANVGEMVVCDRCEGVGEVEDDYTPDYDNYDE